MEKMLPQFARWKQGWNAADAAALVVEEADGRQAPGRTTEEDCMRVAMRMTTSSAAALLCFGLAGSAEAQQSNMTFFVTSAGPGKGGELGGLAGADQHCQQLAQAAGAGSRTWRAY
jgi:hypothetical protein